MGDKSFMCLVFLVVSLISLSTKCYSSSSENDLKRYIVYTGNRKNDETSALLYYQNLLQQVAADSNQEPKPILRYYKRSFGGFVAELTKEEANKMAGLEGVVSVFINKMWHPVTTKSWDFIGLTRYVERQYYFESDIIIGVIDSGIWPESESFNDKGFGPPPLKWMGTCNTSNFTCNNKLIGAKSYLPKNDSLWPNELESPRDTYGHGTHTASTAAGNPVDMASMLGFAQGTARGGAPSARIAVYKVCWHHGCPDENILAAFDDAIADGVDILSVSLAAKSIDTRIYFRDGLSIGSFHAIRNEVLTVVAAGNDGPSPSSIDNFTPWTIVVGASTLDRKFKTKLKLGDNSSYEGVSLNFFDLGEKQYPLINGRDAPSWGVDGEESRYCSINTLNGELVKGKIVICEGSNASVEALRVGAAGILQITDFMDAAYSFPLPACSLQLNDVEKILKYISTTRYPTATIFWTNELNDPSAPVVASFSSRGPVKALPELLKPDLTARGTNIIASWSPMAPVSFVQGDTRKLKFNIISGTSMSCPHVTGAAAYIKSFHRTWSPAAIRSALMTTARQMSLENNAGAEFSYGAGQIDPAKAVNPGLIYDASADDYIRFLCGYGFNITNLESDLTCSNIANTLSARDLNYPSFVLRVPRPEQHFSGSYRRTVTNVGLSISTYRAIVTAPEGIQISVNPKFLSFTSLGEKKNFVLSVDGDMKEAIGSASLVWDRGDLKVRSPIIVYDERAEQESEPKPNPKPKPKQKQKPKPKPKPKQEQRKSSATSTSDVIFIIVISVTIFIVSFVFVYLI